jgi:hypothetical protein
MLISRLPSRRRASVPVALCLGACAMTLLGCPGDDHDDPLGASAQGGATGTGGSTAEGGTGGGGGAGGIVATHTGLVSIQDMSIHGAPAAGHGLTVQAIFAPARAPDYEEQPGLPTGCKAWVYDLTAEPPPPQTDQGPLSIAVGDSSIECRFDQDKGYTCPVWSGSGAAAITPGEGGKATFTAAGATFSPADVGRYLAVSGAKTASNEGAFPIVAVTSATTAVVFHPGAAAEDLAGEYTVIAGAGPVPDNPVDPISTGDVATVGITPAGEMDFDFPDAGPFETGGAFVVDAATADVLGAVPVDGSSIALGCAGEGGTCGSAALTVVRLTTTDGGVAGLSPFAMPEPVVRKVDVLCATLGGDGTLVVPAEAMALIEEAHGASPVTRIRTAYMREGFALAQNDEPLPPNPVRILAGHGILGFTDP